MRGSGKVVIALAMIVSFFIPTISILSPHVEGSGDSPWTPFSPILIDGDADFTSANGVIRGTGADYDPYVMEWLFIENTATPCIEIRNTDAHLLITDMYLVNFLNVTDGAIHIFNSSNIQVANSIVYGLGEAADCGPFLRLDACSNITVLSQKDLGGRGIEAYDTDDVIVTGGNYSPYLIECITLVNSENVTISENRIAAGYWYYAGYGYEVIVSGCRNILVTENDFESFGAGYGFWVCGSVNVSIYHNNIYAPDISSDPHTIVTDVPDELHMDDGYPGGGNYWELYPGTDNYSGQNQDVPSPDGIRDAPLTLGSDTDYYPLMNPVVWYTPAPHHLTASFLSNDLVVNEMMNITAVIIDQYGHEMFGPGFTWANSNPACGELTVNQTNSSRAVFKALWAGLTSINIDSGNLFPCSFELRVSFGLTGLGILPTQKTVDFGNTTNFEAIGTNAYGPLEWLPADWSAEAGKGSIDLDGRFTADKFSGKIYGNGTSTSQCHITAILDGHTAHATVLVQLHNNTDHDDDGILDWQELSVGLNPFNSSDAAEDYDSDWLTNAQEVELGTLLNNNDTDGDYLSDAFEIVFSKTSPTEPDSDHDGVTDGVEFAATHNYSAKLTLTPSGSYGMDITWGDHTFHAETSSVVRDADFNVKERRLTLNLSGKLTSDYLNFSIPTDLCDMEDIVLTIDGVQVHPSAKLVEGFYEVSYEYPSGSHEIVLEFASDGALPAVYWLLLAVVLALGITVAILLVRRSKGS